MKLLEDILAVIGLVAVLGLAFLGAMNLAEQPQADITICDHGKCKHFNVRERYER